MKEKLLLTHLVQLRREVAEFLSDPNNFQNVTTKTYQAKIHTQIELLSMLNKDIKIIESVDNNGVIDTESVIDSKMEKFLERVPEIYKQIMDGIKEVQGETDVDGYSDKQPPMFYNNENEQEFRKQQKEKFEQHQEQVQQSVPFSTLLQSRDILLSEMLNCSDAKRVVAITQELQPIAYAMNFMISADLSLYNPDADAEVDNLPM